MLETFLISYNQLHHDHSVVINWKDSRLVVINCILISSYRLHPEQLHSIALISYNQLELFLISYNKI